jgi:hypothetical protein
MHVVAPTIAKSDQDMDKLRFTAHRFAADMFVADRSLRLADLWPAGLWLATGPLVIRSNRKRPAASTLDPRLINNRHTGQDILS